MRWLQKLRRIYWPVDIEKERVTEELEKAQLRLDLFDVEGDSTKGRMTVKSKGKKQPGLQDQPRFATQHRTKSVKNICEKLLALSREAVHNKEYFSAWGYMLAFERMIIEDMQGDELNTKFVSARFEAKKKLPDWRGEAVASLLTAIDSKNDKNKRDQLHEIMFHLHTKSQNTYFKIAKLKNQTFAVMWMLTIASTIVFGLSFWFMNKPFFNDVTRFDFHLAMLAGLVGSVLSVAYSVIRTEPDQKIPELKASLPLTWARSFFGPLVAFALLIFIESDLINLGAFKPESLVGSSFMAGFSERWFLNLVSKAQEKTGG